MGPSSSRVAKLREADNDFSCNENREKLSAKAEVNRISQAKRVQDLVGFCTTIELAEKD